MHAREDAHGLPPEPPTMAPAARMTARRFLPTRPKAVADTDAYFFRPTYA